MNKTLIISFVTISFLALAGGYYLSSPKTKDKMMTNDNPQVMKSINNVMEKDNVSDEKTMDNSSLNNGEYVSYSSDYLELYSEKTKILFFHASWCPTCKAADKDISNNLSNIPENTVIIKTDYDTQSDLKKKYGISYQHTFVIVDDQGNEIEKWNGGSFKEIIERI
jgi:thioredoxin 1